MIRFLAAGSVVVSVIFSANTLYADRVVLKNGGHFEDVKTVPQAGYQFIIFPTGHLQRVENSQILSLDIIPVSWKQGPDQTEINRLVAAAVKTEVEKRLAEENEKREALEKIQRQEAREKTFGSLMRAVAFPGWSQIYRGDRMRGYTYFGVMAFLSLNYIISYQKFRRAQNDYNDVLLPISIATVGQAGILASIPIFESRRQELKQSEGRTNQIVALLGVVWTVNLIDALYFAIDPMGKNAYNRSYSPHIVALTDGKSIRLGMEALF